VLICYNTVISDNANLAYCTTKATSYFTYQNNGTQKLILEIRNLLSEKVVVDPLASLRGLPELLEAQFLNHWAHKQRTAELLGRYFLGYSRNSPHVMEPEGPVPCSQDPTTAPHPELEKSRPHPHITFL
jgi:hypothetical protein